MLYSGKEDKGHGWSFGAFAHCKLDPVEDPAFFYPIVDDIFEDIVSDGLGFDHFVLGYVGHRFTYAIVEPLPWHDMLKSYQHQRV